MVFTKNEVVRRLAQKSGYWQKDIDNVLRAYDELLLEIMDEATNEEEIEIKIFTGVRIGCKLVKPRQRVNPKTGQSIMCGTTVKPFVKWSSDFRKKIQSRFDDRQFDGN